MSSLSLINKSTDIINGNRNQGEFENNHQKQYLIELIRHSIITNGRDVFYFKFDKQPFLLSNSTYKNSSNSSNDGDNNEINNTMIINDVPIFVRMDTNDYIGKNNMMISTIMLPLFQGKLPALHTNNDNELLDVNNTCKKRKRNQQAHDVNQKKNSPNIGSLKHNTTKKIARGDEEDDCSYDKDNNNDDNNVNESNNATNQTNSTANHWKYKIKSGLQQRLKYELKKKMKQRNIQLIQQRVLQQNRIILQRLSLRGLSGLKSSSISSPNANTPTPTTKKKRNDVCMNKSILDDTAILEMMHIRHKVQTIDGMASTTSTTSTHHQNSLSVKIHFSIDIWFHEKNRDNGTFSESTTATSTTKSKSKSINDHSNVNHLHNVQLSSSFNSVQGQSNVIVKTHSAVVPWLCLGECVTILATVYVSGIQLINGLSTPISLTLNAFWENYHHDHQNTGNAVDTNIGSIEKGDKVFDSNILNMKGIALGSFDIPVESILLDQQISNVANSEQDCGMTNFKKFYPVMDGGGYSASNNDRAIVSNAIYEYRRPRIVLIDVSNNVSADVIDEWKIQMTSINRRLSNGSYIDVYHDKERMQIKATALAESPELRSSIVELILKYLPENAQIVDSLVEPIKERSLVASILDAAKKEVQLIESHSTMTNKLSMTELCQIVGAQSKTDELAARLIMLQKQKK